MKNRNGCRITVMVFGICLFCFGVVQGQEKAAPAKLSSATIIKLAAFEKKISAGGEVSVYVMGDSKVAKQFKKAIGTKIGDAVLKHVDEGTSLPEKSPAVYKPSIYFIGGDKYVAESLTYTRNNDVLSVTANPKYSAEGVTLTISVGGNGKPKVTLNLTSSANEGCDWNPAIMKVAKTIK